MRATSTVVSWMLVPWRWYRTVIRLWLSGDAFTAGSLGEERFWSTVLLTIAHASRIVIFIHRVLGDNFREGGVRGRYRESSQARDRVGESSFFCAGQIKGGGGIKGFCS